MANDIGFWSRERTFGEGGYGGITENRQQPFHKCSCGAPFAVRVLLYKVCMGRFTPAVRAGIKVGRSLVDGSLMNFLGSDCLRQRPPAVATAGVYVR